jgi:hypothetical protein
MAKPRARKLKVYQAQFGFFDSVVAAPSQAAALRAWGTHQDLFASGDARISSDEAAVKAALEHPETPLQRAAGTRDAFKLKATGSPSVGPKTAARKRAPRPKPDRSRLEAAEAALRDLDLRREDEEAAFQREQDALEARRSAARKAYARSREAAVSALEAARAAYRRGGKDQKS